MVCHPISSTKLVDFSLEKTDLKPKFLISTTERLAAGSRKLWAKGPIHISLWATPKVV